MSHELRAAGSPGTADTGHRAIRAWLGSDAACCVALALVTLGVFYPSVGAGFVYDDSAVVTDNPLVNSHEVPVLRLFRQPFPSAGSSFRMYRPLTILSYRLNAIGRRADPVLFHSVNISLHVITTVLFFAFLRAAFAPRLPATLGALLFALLPGHAEAVLWVSARGDILVAVACLLGFLLVSRRPRRWPPSPPALLALCALYLTALLFKESAVVFPFLVIAAAGLGTQNSDRTWRGGWRPWAALAAFSVPVIAYVLLRHGATGGLRVIESTTIAHASIAGRLALAFRLIAVAATTMAWAPTPHVLYWWADPLRWDWQAALGVAVAAGLLCTVWRTRDRAVRGGAAIALIAFLPHLRPLGGLELFAERYLYLPSLGFCVLVTALLARARLGRRQAWAAGLTAGWCLVLGSQTLAYASVWVDNVALWEYTHRLVPGSPKALRNYAVSLVKAGRHEEAKAAFEALARVPGYETSARKDLLAVLTALGEAEDGIRVASTLTAAGGSDPEALFLLGRCQLLSGRRLDALLTITRLDDLAGADDHARYLARRLAQETGTGPPADPLPTWFLAPERTDSLVP